MNKFYSFLILINLTATALFAQNKLGDNLYFKKLSNGLSVLVVEDHSVPLATINITFKGGIITEDNTTSGLTMLFGNMLERGDKKYKDQREFNYNGGDIGILPGGFNTRNEFTQYSFTLPKTNIEAGLSRMNDMMRYPRMDPSEFELEKKAMTDGLKERESRQYTAFDYALPQHLWGNNYARKTGINKTNITNATMASMMLIKRKYYNPDNALLIIDGDVAHDDMFKLVQKIYGTWLLSGSDPFKNWPVPEFKPLVKNDYFVTESPFSSSPLISLNWHGPDTRNDIQSTYAADVFSYLVNQSSSKLHKALVESGLAFYANITYTTLKHVGPVELVVRPNPAKIKECTDELLRQIDLMDNDDYLSAQQIEIGKRMMEITNVRNEEIATNYTMDLGFWWASASLNYYINYNENMKKVTQADLKAYVRKYIKGKPYCAGLLLNPDLRDQLTSGPFAASKK